jgi:hypothetical protein
VSNYSKEMQEAIRQSDERDTRNRLALFQILILLEYPGVRQLDPKRDAYRLWWLHYEGLLEDATIESRVTEKHKDNLVDVLRVVKEMTPGEKQALRQRILREPTL